MSKAPGAVQSAVALALSIVVATLALNVSQAPPPAIAEFSPSAVEQVETPEEQAGKFGGGALDVGASAGPTTTTTSPDPSSARQPEDQQQEVALADAPIVKSRQKRCVGDPPRQIEDPQSPPCVDYFDGDNGGATSQGVTANEVRVAVVEADFPKTHVQPYQAFFNSRFQFYGRKITFEYLKGPAMANPTQEKAAASEAAERKVFAGLGGGNISLNAYFRELAAEQIMAIGFYPYFTSTELAGMRPYTWQFRSAIDVDSSNYGLWACNRLGGGRKAIHASGVDKDARPIAEQPRKFAVYYSRYMASDPYGPEDLVESLASCGINVDPDLVFKRDASARYALNPGDPVNVGDVQKMKNAGVTTVLCMCHVISQNSIMGAASAQSWSPEWPSQGTFGGQACNHCNRSFLGSSPNQRRQLFGVISDYKVVPVADSSWCVALREQGEECPAAGSQHSDRQRYRVLYGMMLLLASGIQMAGPNLTPESFEKGLRGATFPNPPHYTNPARVGFNTGYAMLDGDIAEFYWRDGAIDAEDGSPGANCYVNGGKFHQRKDIPKDPPVDFFPPDDGNGANCDSGANPQRE